MKLISIGGNKLAASHQGQQFLACQNLLLKNIEDEN